MITFTGIIFSAVFVAAQIQTSSYSPRLAARLRRDPVVIAGLALPTATATYALFALAAIGAQSDRAGRPFAPPRYEDASVYDHAEAADAVFGDPRERPFEAEAAPAEDVREYYPALAPG